MNSKNKSTLEKIRIYLNFKNYSDNSIKIYLHYCNLFLSSFDKDVYHISQSEAINWLLNYKYSSISQQNQIISSVKFIYKFIVKCELSKFNIERPRREKHLPIVLSIDEIQSMFNVCDNLKHKVILILIYSCGLRVSELINLKWDNIDRKRKIINIINAKGNKDRRVALPDVIITILENYYRKERPEIYVLNGKFGIKYSRTSVLNVVKSLAYKAGINKRVYTHLIRHCAFTHLVENGTEISLVQKIAGHNDVKTTMLYVHISDSLISKIHSPIEQIQL